MKLVQKRYMEYSQVLRVYFHSQPLIKVYNCENTTEVYEDRSYECFGNFSDSGLVYTVVRRLDLPHR